MNSNNQNAVERLLPKAPAATNLHSFSVVHILLRSTINLQSPHTCTDSPYGVIPHVMQHTSAIWMHNND